MSGKPRDKRLWVKVLVDFVDHEKTIAAIDEGGGDAGWLWLKAMSWSRRRLTDGRLPHAVVRDLARFSKAKPEKLAAALVNAGLWEAVEGGYQIHDFADFAPTKEQVEAKREATRTNVANYRRKQAGNKAAGNADVTGYKRDTGADVTPMFDPVSEVSEVSDPPSPPDPSSTNAGVTSAARRDGAAPSGSAEPTEGDIVRAYVRGVEDGTAGPFGRKLDADDRGQLTYLWERYALANEQPVPADFLARLTANVTEWVRIYNNPKERKYAAGWAVHRFVAWLQERADAESDEPEAAPKASRWADPTPDELAAAGVA